MARSPTYSRSPRSATMGKLRIIGGRWRGRKLAFHPTQGLRPTSDRVRETLFNWLAPVIQDAHCADLFAGSGALGLEALSRGAASCDFIDSTKSAIQQISGHLKTLDAASQGQCHHLTAQQYLAGLNTSLDIVFIDPPFHQSLVSPCCEFLSESGALSDDSLVYIESSRKEALTNLPPGWQLYRQKTAGDVSFQLYEVNRNSPAL